MMHRPIMNPNWVDDDSAPKQRTWWDRLAPVRRVLRLVGKILLWDPLTRTRFRGLRIEDGTPWERFCRGLLYRLTFIPVFVALTVAALVYSGTHPRQNANEVDPNAQGIYYDAVTLRTDDGVRLEAWLVPVLEADQILRQKEMALRITHPAVLLVHDYGCNRQQMLPLVKPLHDAGFVVMVLATARLRAQRVERIDVWIARAERRDRRHAGVTEAELCRSQAAGDCRRWHGANAALLAADDVPNIKAFVLDHPQLSANEVLESRVGPHYASVNWVRPLCKWAFELCYQVHADDLDLAKFSDVLSHRKVLMLDNRRMAADFGPATSKNICRYLSANLLPQDVATVDQK